MAKPSKLTVCLLLVIGLLATRLGMMARADALSSTSHLNHPGTDTHRGQVKRTVQVGREPAAPSEHTDSTAAEQQQYFDFPPSVKDIVINVGSNLDPILPSHDLGPCAVSIAVEPVVGCQIQSHPQLHVVHAAISKAAGIASMKVYNKAGVSSSLAKPTTKSGWNSNRKRGDGKLLLVPVITLTSLLESIPQTVRIRVLMTAMQGYDFVAVKAAGPAVFKRASHILAEVWENDVQTYSTENDLCRDWLPFMTKLGYTLIKVTDQATRKSITNKDAQMARCTKQLRESPERPSNKFGLSESDAQFVRNDAVGQPFPDTTYRISPNMKPHFTANDYAKC